MWVFVCFDLPVKTKANRIACNEFRTFIKRQGFDRFQYSIYLRFCLTVASKKTYIKRLCKKIPFNGKISIFSLTNKEFKEMKSFHNKKREKKIEKILQLELF
jgi:CRISPR-associated protein Cas2